MADELVLKTATGDMKVAEYGSPEENERAVIIVHEAFGLNDHIKEVAARTANEGFYALAPDFFHLTENSVVGYDDLGSALELIASLDDENVLTDIDACLQHLSENGIAPEATGIVGFCMGGRIVFVASLNRKLGAGATFYGGGIVTENITGAPALTSQAKNLQTPWLGLFGDMDSMIPVEGVEELREALKEASVDNEIIRYPDADHGFHCNEREESYNPIASTDAWERTLTWFHDHLAS